MLHDFNATLLIYLKQSPSQSCWYKHVVIDEMPAQTVKKYRAKWWWEKIRIDCNVELQY